MKNLSFGNILFVFLISSIGIFGQQKSFINYSFQDNNVMKSKTSDLKISMYIGKTIIGVAKSTSSILKSNYQYNLNSQRVTGLEFAMDKLVPINYSLEQNYPNPFNPVTRIKYSIPQESFVSLAIYNMLGEKVVELISETKSAGTYTVDWDAKNFTSGIYIYSIRSANYTASRKLILLK